MPLAGPYVDPWRPRCPNPRPCGPLTALQEHQHDVCIVWDAAEHFAFFCLRCWHIHVCDSRVRTGLLAPSYGLLVLARYTRVAGVVCLPIALFWRVDNYLRFQPPSFGMAPWMGFDGLDCMHGGAWRVCKNSSPPCTSIPSRFTDTDTSIVPAHLLSWGRRVEPVYLCVFVFFFSCCPCYRVFHT